MSLCLVFSRGLPCGTLPNCLIQPDLSLSLFLQPYQVSEATSWSHLSHQSTLSSHRISTEYNTKVTSWFSRQSWATMSTALLSLPSSVLKITKFGVSLDSYWNIIHEEVREECLNWACSSLQFCISFPLDKSCRTHQMLKHRAKILKTGFFRTSGLLTEGISLSSTDWAVHYNAIVRYCKCCFPDEIQNQIFTSYGH